MRVEFRCPLDKALLVAVVDVSRDPSMPSIDRLVEVYGPDRAASECGHVDGINAALAAGGEEALHALSDGRHMLTAITQALTTMRRQMLAREADHGDD
jgi:hypothetical protein